MSVTQPDFDTALADSRADSSWSKCEQLIEAFEKASRAGQQPQIEDYLLIESPAREALLLELVHADLELRLKSGEPTRVEYYLSRYPQLAQDSAIVSELLDAEYELRRRIEPDLAWEEYAGRFPSHAESMRGRAHASTSHGSTHLTRANKLPPPAVADYEILGEIGRGGMGVIYKAMQTRLKRHVALKFLPQELTSDRALLDRFVREAVTVSGLNHPNICTVHELGEHEGRPFIAMEFVSGQTLQAVAAQRPAVSEICQWMSQVARALAAAHAAGVVHRDIKPENIMLRDDGYVKVLDFGLARRLPKLNEHDTRGSNDTSPGALLGTIAYMSPEQARGDALGGSSDIFSLGVVFYQLVTGSHPFENASAFSTLHAIATARPIVPSRLNTEISPALSGLIEAMLNKDPRLRPTADAVEMALDRFARREERPRPATSFRPIVHRQPELSVLRDALSAADSGFSRVVCVTGEPGIGKTTLVEDFLGEVAISGAAYAVGRGRCSERQAGTEAFLPVLEALRDLVANDGTGALPRLMKVLAPTWNGQLERTHTVATGESARAASQHAMMREFRFLLEELSRLSPVILFFDDVHWADVSTVDLLAYFGRYRESMRTLVVATYRPTEMLLGPHPFHHVKLDLQAQGACSEIAVGFLDRDGIDQYLQLAFPNHDFQPDFADLVHSRTEGSPLFMADLLAYLREQSVITNATGRWSLAGKTPDLRRDLPQSVRGMIERKFGQLGSEDRHLLEASAIQGVEFDSATVSAAVYSGPAAVEDRLQRLERVHGVIRRLEEMEFPDLTLSQRYVFVHVLYQQALLSEIAPSRRATLSRTMAQALVSHHGFKRTPAAAEIACLFEVGRDHPQAATFFYFAAQNAAQIFAHREAIALAQRGLQLLEGGRKSKERDALELALQMALGLQIQLAEGYASDGAKQAYDRARELCQSAKPSETLFPILWGLWLYYKVRSQLTRAQQLANELSAQARALNNPDLALQAHQALGMTAFCRGEPAVSLRHVEQVATLYSPTQHSQHAALFGQDPAVICKAFGAIALWLLGFPDAARKQSEAAIAISRDRSPTSQSIALHFAAMLYQLCGDPQRTRSYADASANIAAEHGLSFWLAGGGVMTGWSLVAMDNMSDGIRQLRQGLDDWQATGSATYRTYYLALLAETLARAGQLAEAQTVLDEALALVEKTDERFFEAELHRLRGELLLKSLDHVSPESAAPAKAAFHYAIEISRRQEAKSLLLRAVSSLVRLEQQLEDAAESQKLLSETLASFTQGTDTRDLNEAAQLLQAASP